MTGPLKYYHTGRPIGKGKETLFFVHGYPDDHALFDKQVEFFGKENTCITVDLPNFGREVSKTKRWGFSSEEVVDALHDTIDSLGLKRPVVLVAHDWGAFYSWRMAKKYPQSVKKIVGMDVGAKVKPSLQEAVFLVMYQSVIIFLFILDNLTNLGIGTRVLHAILPKNEFPTPLDQVTSLQGWPYFCVWREVAMAIASKSTSKSENKAPKSVSDLVTHPTLYMWGGAGFKKRLTFEAPDWVGELRQRPDCAAVKLKDGGHWFFCHHAEVVNPLIDSFIKGNMGALKQQEEIEF